MTQEKAGVSDEIFTRILRPYGGWKTDNSIVVCDRQYLAKSLGNLLTESLVQASFFDRLKTQL